jgi:hypothetical protein
MRIAYVVSFAFPNASAGTRRVIGICQALVHAGAEVTIYSAGGFCKSASDLAGLPNGVRVIYSGDRRSEEPLRAHIMPPLFFGRKMSKLLSANLDDFDSMLLYSGYTPMLLRLLYLGRRHGKKLFFDAVEWASKGRSWWLSPYYLNVEFAMRFLVPKCDGVLCISSFLEDWYATRTCTLRIPAIYSIPDFSLSTPLPPEPSRKTPIKIAYLGNSDHDHVVLICEFLQKNQKMFDSIQLHIAGNFKGLEAVEEMFSGKTNNSQIVIHGQLSQEQALELLKNSHLMIFLRERNAITSAGFPTKFVQSFSNSIPVITNSSSDLDFYLQDGKNCIKVSSISDEGLLDAFWRVKALTNEGYKGLAFDAHQCAVSFFAPKVHSDRLFKFFD